MKPSSATQATTSLCTGLLLLGLAVVYLRSLSLSFVWEAEQLLIRETGLLALVSLLAGTALKCLHDLLQSCRDSRCKKIKVCCLTCDNEILTGQELRELQDVPANTDRDENSINV